MPNSYRMPARSSGELATTTSEGKSAETAVAVATVVRSSRQVATLTSFEPTKERRTDALASADGLLSKERGKSKSAQARTRITFAAWEDSIGNAYALAPDDPVYVYADKVGLPVDYLHLAWKAFSAEHKDKPARSNDWRAVFLRHVRNGYPGLWTHHGGAFHLTTRGKQAAIEHDMRDLIADAERTR